jgi:hypothetical protein
MSCSGNNGIWRKWGWRINVKTWLRMDIVDWISVLVADIFEWLATRFTEQFSITWTAVSIHRFTWSGLCWLYIGDM